MIGGIVRQQLPAIVAVALLASSEAAIAADAAPLMTVLLKPSAISETANKGNLDIVMTVPAFQAAAGQPLFSLEDELPNYAYAQKVENLQVTDAKGAVPLSDRTANGRTWTSSRDVRGDLTVRYHLPLENIPLVAGGPPTGLRIDDDGFSGLGGTLLAVPKTKTPYRIAIKWDLSGLGPGAEAVSSYGDGDVGLPAGPLARLNQTMFMAGHLQHEPAAKSSAAFSADWLGHPPFDARATMQWVGKMHGWMSRFFDDKVEPLYHVFLRFNPMNAPGGAAFPNNFLMTYAAGDNVTDMNRILGHEMTHTWTAMPGMEKWYNEGDAVYYQVLLPWRAGMATTDEYLADVNLTASRYYTNPLAHTPEDQVLAVFWQDTRLRVLPYDRGAIYFAVLNGKIRKTSGGKRSVDDLIKAMMALNAAGSPVTESTWLDLLRKEIGEDGPKVHKAMLAGEWMLPESDDFGPCFRRVTKKIRRFDLGFDIKTLIGNDHIIHGLEPGSEAAKAGLKDGDRISYGISIDMIQAHVLQKFNLQVTRDGKTFPMSYLPRGEAVDAYQWERIESVPESACKT